MRFLLKSEIIPKSPADRLSFARAVHWESSPDYLAQMVLGVEKGDVDFSKFKTVDLMILYEDLVKWNDPSDFKDQFYRYLREAVKKSDPLTQAFFQPNIRMILDSGLRKEAMMHRLNLESDALRDPKLALTPPGSVDHVRPELRTIRELIEKNLNPDDPVRNEVLEIVQKRFRTSSKESDFLSTAAFSMAEAERLQGRSTMYNSARFDQLIETPEKNFKILQYLLGDNKTDYPDFVRNISNIPDRRKAMHELDDYFVKYKSAGTDAKALVLQPLFGAKNGLLSSPEMQAKTEATILGQYNDNTVVSRMLKSYLANTKKEDRNITYAKFLSSLTTDGKTASGAAKQSLELNKVLSSMYAFGDRVSQGLAVSPWLSQELRDTASEAFTNSHPPTRQDVFDNLHVFFGNTVAAELDPELVGAGSINSVVKVKMKDPETGAMKDVVVRMQKAGARGQIKNQNEVWQDVVTDLEKDPNAEVRRAANYMSEIREYAMHSLQDNGSDLNQELERKSHPRARQVYQEPGGVAHPKTGFKTEVTKPLEAYQKAYVPDKYSKFVSIYEYVPNVPLEEVDPKLRQGLATQALEAELRAIFEHGEFDPEPHPGNWLFDINGKRAVRTDYASFMKIPDSDRLALRGVFSALMQPQLSAGDISALSTDLPRLFKDDRTVSSIIGETLRVATADGNFPSFQDPSERLLFLRKALEDHFEKKTGKIQPLKFSFNTQSAFGALQKTSRFRAHIPKMQIANAFMTATGTSKAKMALSFIRSAADCAPGFAKIGATGK